MLQTCFGIYAALSLFTFLIFLGTLFDAQRHDKGSHPKAKT